MSDTNSHKEEMEALQAEQRRKVQAAKSADRGLVLVNTGDGKGKSSAAFGVIARALGWGKRVGVVQFIKGDWLTGEKQFFDKIGGVDWFTMGAGFTWDTQDRAADIVAANAAFAKAVELMQAGTYDLVVLDEINIALQYEYLGAEEVIAGLQARSNHTSVILTGRNAPQAICDYADLVTDMREVKHPFNAGINAQRGIDF